MVPKSTSLDRDKGFVRETNWEKISKTLAVHAISMTIHGCHRDDIGRIGSRGMHDDESIWFVGGKNNQTNRSKTGRSKSTGA